MRILLLLGDFGLPTLVGLLASPYRPVAVVLATSPAVPPPGAVGKRVRAWLRPLLWPGSPGPVPRDLRPWTAAGVLAHTRIPAVAASGLDDAALCRLVATHRADLLLSAGYPRILPVPVLDAAPRGALNVHPSLLPRYRGPSPVFWQVALGETRSGITIHRMTSRADEGPIVAQAEISVGAEESAGALFLRLARLAARLVPEILGQLEGGTVVERPQDAAAASYQRRFREEDALIAWSRPGEELARIIRACNPSPGARTFLPDGESVRIWRARARAGPVRGAPGAILARRPGGLDVAAGDGVLRIMTATSDRGRRFPAWGRPWPTLAPGMAFAPQGAP